LATCREVHTYEAESERAKNIAFCFHKSTRNGFWNHHRNRRREHSRHRVKASRRILRGKREEKGELARGGEQEAEGGRKRGATVQKNEWRDQSYYKK